MAWKFIYFKDNTSSIYSIQRKITKLWHGNKKVAYLRFRSARFTGRDCVDSSVIITYTVHCVGRKTGGKA
jgi:hypothetical protein